MQDTNTLLLLAPNSIPDISSTEMREKVKKGESLHNLVTAPVEEYIKKNKLYV